MTIIFRELDQFLDRLVEHHNSKNVDDLDLDIYVCCLGGFIDRIPIIADLIKKYNYTIYVAEASSAVLSILMSLDKNRIKAFEDAHFMDHHIQWDDPKNTNGSWEKTKNYLIELQRQVWVRYYPPKIMDFLYRSSKNSYYFTAQEALEYGIVGEIVPSLDNLSKM